MFEKRVPEWELPSARLPKDYRHIVLSDTDTTMKDAARAAASSDPFWHKHGLAIQAFHMRAGRGSVDPGTGQHRPWDGGNSNLLVSVLMDSRTLHRREIGLIAALAMREAIFVMAVPRGAVDIISPNDFFMGERKIGGLLTDELPEGRCNLGIGINVHSAPATLANGKYEAGCLNDVMNWKDVSGPGSRRRVQALTGRFLNNLERHYQAALKDRLSVFRSLGITREGNMTVRPDTPESVVSCGVYEGFLTEGGKDFLQLRVGDETRLIPRPRFMMNGRFMRPSPDPA